jgi:hypothetical protein
MPYLPSSAPTVKQALIDLLTARTALSNVLITYGWTREPEVNTISVGRIEYENEEWRALGNRRKEERFYIECHLWVLDKAQTQKEATERAYVLMGEIELQLRETPRITGALGAGYQEALWEFDPQAVEEAPGPEGYQSMAEARIHVIARK